MITVNKTAFFGGPKAIITSQEVKHHQRRTQKGVDSHSTIGN